jgi:hypothetical protein
VKKGRVQSGGKEATKWEVVTVNAVVMVRTVAVASVTGSVYSNRALFVIRLLPLHIQFWKNPRA